MAEQRKNRGHEIDTNTRLCRAVWEEAKRLPVPYQAPLCLEFQGPFEPLNMNILKYKNANGSDIAGHKLVVYNSEVDWRAAITARHQRQKLEKKIYKHKELPPFCEIRNILNLCRKTQT